jgi:hypothetical protein
MKCSFVTIWYIKAPLEDVCGVIYQSMEWPQWWPNVESVEEIAPGDAQGIGCVRRYTWRGRLPYRLIFDVQVINSVPLKVIEGVAHGDVEGTGHWLFSAEGDMTIVRYEWRIRITPLWMNVLAIVARPVIEWNHKSVMQRGGEALAQTLKVPLLGIEHVSLESHPG